MNATIASGTATGTILADDCAPFGAPQSFSATAVSASQVSLSWAPVSGATGYEVHRATSISSGYSFLFTTPNTSYLDGAVIANTAYLYKVRAIGGAGTSAFSSVDAATAITFTDTTLSSAVQVKRLHITELHTAVNAMRAAAGLAPATFTDSDITTQSTRLKAVHITELREALNAARSMIGLATLSYTDPTITVGSTTAKAAHVTELRAGTR